MAGAGQGPVVAHCATPFLWDGGGSWIHSQIASLRRWNPVVLTQEARHLDQFPVDRLLTAEDLGPLEALVNRCVRRLTGEYPYYGAWLRDVEAQLVHAHFGYQACRCLRAIRQTGLPLITTFYGADATSYAAMKRWREPYRRLFDRGHLFLAEGSTLAARVVEAGAPEDRVRVHHLGVDTQRIPFRRRTEIDRPVRVLMCGHFREKKGFPDGVTALGRAMSGLPDVPVELAIIGDGPQRPQVERAIESAGISACVTMEGYKSYSYVVQSLTKCDILLQPSRTASDGDSEGGAPVILLDAQAAGVPVVSTTHADIPEYVLDGHTGWLAVEGDLDGLVDRLRQALTSSAQWGDMGQLGRRHVESEYDCHRQGERLEQIYDEIAGA